MLALELHGRLARDFSLRLQILLVPHHENHHVRVALVLDFLQPRGQVVESFPSVDRVAKENSVSCSVEDFCNRSERLLASSVPDLQLEEGVFDFDAAGAEVDSHCHVVLRVELVLCQSRQDTRLAHA